MILVCIILLHLNIYENLFELKVQKNNCTMHIVDQLLDELID